VTFYTDGNPATPDFVGGSVFDSSGFKPLRVISPAGYATHFEYDALYREAGRQVFYGHELTLNPRYLAHQSARAQASAQAAAQAATQAAAAQSASAEAAQAVNAVASAQQALGSATATLDARLTVLDAAVAAAGDAAPYLLAVAAAQTSAGTAAATLNSATTGLENAQAALAELQAADPNADTFSAQQAVDLAQTAVDNATTAHNDSQIARAAAETALFDHTLPLRQAVDYASMAHSAALPAVTQAEADLATAQAAHDQALMMVELTIEGTQERTDALSALAAAAAAMQVQQGGLASANAAVTQAQQQVTDATSALGNATSGSVGNAKAAFDSATQAQADAQQTVQTAQDYSATAAAQAQNKQAASAAASAAATAAATYAAAAATAKTIQEADQAANAALAQAGIATAHAGQPPPSAGSPPPPAMALPEAETRTTYDAVGKPLTATDPLGRVTRNTYDGLGQLVKVTEPDTTADLTDNPTVQTLYTHHGKPWKVIDQMGNVTTTTYDAAGRAVEVKAPAVNGPGGQAVQAITTMEYDAAGNTIAVTDALGRVTETVYDERNRPVAVYAPTVWDANAAQFVRSTSRTTYDALGQVLTVTDPMGAVTTKHYDHAGRNWKVEAPAPEANAPRPTSLTTFDPGGLALTVTNPLNQTVTNTYDALGRLITTEDAEGISNSFGYDAAGNRTSVTDGKNQTTTFVYDGLNRLISQTFASVTTGVAGDTTSFTYNAVQKIAQTSPRGIVTTYGYDARDRLLTVSAPAHAGTPALGRSYTYDSAGKLLTVSESTVAAGVSTPNPANVSYVYDALGRVTAESSRGQVHFYHYDLAGNRIRAQYSTGRVVETSYDGLNRPEIIAEGGRVTQYGYDLGGRAVILIAANGQTSQNSHDALGRLKDRTLFKTSAMQESEVLAQFEWEHDLLGNVLAQHETWPGEVTRPQNIRSTVMSYDDNNRLLSETIQTRSNGAAPPVDQSETAYTYDDANNRATKTVTRIAGAASSAEAGENDVGHWAYTYNSANQLTGWEKSDYPSGSPQKTATLSYDDAGNRTSQAVTQAASLSTTSYAWDAQDRLASVTMPDGSEHEYAYDYRTRRIETSRSGGILPPTSTAIVFSGGLSLAEYESETGSLPVTPTVEYTRGPDMGGGVGGMLYSIRSSSIQNQASSIKYSLSNGRGDIVAQSDSNTPHSPGPPATRPTASAPKKPATNKDKQRGNSKDEDPTGLLNEGLPLSRHRNRRVAQP
jgi:YD repeat-containing protein